MGTKIHKNKLTPFSYFELGINKKYAIGGTQMDNLRKWLNEQSISSTFLYNDQSEYLVSIRAYPFWMEKFFDGVGTESGIPIGPFSANETHVTGKLITSQKAPIEIGSYTFTRYYNDFMDFAPYTKINVYIPYIGFRQINVNEVMGKTVTFYAQVDFDNGLMSVWLETEDSMIQSWETSLGVDIALNRTNGTELARNLFMWGIKSVTSTGALSIGAQTDKDTYSKSVKVGGDIGTGFIGANQHHVNRGEIARGINELYNPTSIYLIFEREIPEITDLTDYKKLYGLPTEQTLSLSTVKGYTEIGEIHFNPMGYDIYDDEIAELNNLLRGGVHF